MGYNRALVQDESVSFVFTFSSSEPGAALSVCGLKSGGLLLEKTVTRCAMEADRNPTRVKGANNVLVYREVTDHRITFVYQNKSESSTIVQMELNKSKGIVHSRESEVSTSLSKIVNNITQTQRSPSHKIQITKSVKGASVYNPPPLTGIAHMETTRFKHGLPLQAHSVLTLSQVLGYM